MPRIEQDSPDGMPSDGHTCGVLGPCDHLPKQRPERSRDEYEEAFAETAAFCAGWSAAFDAVAGDGPGKVEIALHAYEAERGGFPKVPRTEPATHVCSEEHERSVEEAARREERAACVAYVRAERDKAPFSDIRTLLDSIAIALEAQEDRSGEPVPDPVAAFDKAFAGTSWPDQGRERAHDGFMGAKFECEGGIRVLVFERQWEALKAVVSSARRLAMNFDAETVGLTPIENALVVDLCRLDEAMGSSSNSQEKP